MNKNRFMTAFLISVLTLISSRCFAAEVTLNDARAQVYFSPHGGDTDAIVKILTKAKSEILVQAYSFTSTKIAKAMIDAHKRNVPIEIILDKSNVSKKYSAADFMSHAGIPTYIDSQHAIAHNKIMIIDNEIVITGSFNFTKAAENNNAENLMIISSKDLAKFYKENWSSHKAHSNRYEGK